MLFPNESNSMKHRTLIFVLLLSLSFRVTAQKQLISIPIKEKLELLDPYGNHANWKEDPNDITSWISYDEALDEWEWPEGESPPELWMKVDSIGKSYQIYKEKNQLLSEEKYADLCLIYHPANEKYYIRFKDSKTKAYGLMTPSGQLLVEPKYRFLEILPWGNKNFDPLFLYSTKVSNNYFTKLSEVDGQGNIFGTLNAENGKTSIEQFFKVFILPHAERYFCAKLISKDSIHYALHSKYFDALTPPIFERTEVLKEDWTFESATLDETEEAGIAHPLYYNTVIDQSTIILQEKGKKVVYDYDGNELLQSEWDSLFRGPNSKIYICKNKGDKGVGALNIFGELLLKADYQEIFIEQLTAKLRAIGGLKPKTNIYSALLDTNAQLLTDFIFNVIAQEKIVENFDPEIFAMQVDTVLEYKMDANMQELKEAMILRQKDKACLYDLDGKQLVAPIWDSIQAIGGNPNYLLVKDKGQLGLIKIDGELMIQPQFQSLTFLDGSTNKFIAKKEKGFILVNDKGRKLKRKVFKSAYYNPQLELLTLSKNGLDYALFDKDLNCLTPYKFKTTLREVITFDPNTLTEWSDTFYIKPGELYFDSLNQTVVLQTAKGQGLYNAKGERLIPAKFKELSYFVNEKASFYIKVENAEAKMALFDQAGKQYTDFIYKSMYCFDSDKEIYSYEEDGNTKRTVLKLE